MSSPAVKIRLHPESGIEFKACSRCKELKPVWGFNKDKQKSIGIASACRECASITSRESYNRCIDKRTSYWKARTKEQRQLEYQKLKNSGAKLRHDLQRYGLTETEYNQLVKKQNGVCRCCGISPEQTKFSRLAVDHNHKTGKVRGLLCGSCNRALGMLRENVKTLEAMICYLKEYNIE